MAQKIKADKLPAITKVNPKVPVIGVFAPCDPRIDKQSRGRAQNVVGLVADAISGQVVLPDKTAVPVVYSDILVDNEAQAIVQTIHTCQSFPYDLEFASSEIAVLDGFNRRAKYNVLGNKTEIYRRR